MNNLLRVLAFTGSISTCILFILKVFSPLQIYWYLIPLPAFITFLLALLVISLKVGKEKVTFDSNEFDRILENRR